LKTVIIEDDQASIDIVSLIFKVSHPEIQLFSSKLGEEGLDLIVKENPDVVILDLGLPDIDGFEVLKRIRLFSDLPVLVLTVRGDENDVAKALELGADDYIIKPFRHLEFLARIKKIMGRGSFIQGKPYINFKDFNFDVSMRRLTCGQKIIYLTGIESQILYHLTINKGRIVTYKSLYDSIWGDYYPGQENALRVHIQRLRKKIELNKNEKHLIINKPGLGYMLNISS
jgi:two-component system KDP operon response regulator KdpE